MADIKKVFVTGRLTRDPELRKTGSGISVVSFRIACSRPKTQGQEHPEADFFKCTAWRNTADFIDMYCSKGNRVAISGTLQNSSYENQSGQKITETEIVVDTIQLFDYASDSAQAPKPKPQAQAQTQEPQFDFNTGSVNVVDPDDDLPF